LKIFNFSRKNQSGFTLTELLVVLAIMGVFFGLILANYAGMRGKRDIKIAQNELTTNIRKVQSYALSSRDTSIGPVKLYVLKFDTTRPFQYLIEAVQTDYSLTTPLETVNLPRGVTIQSVALQQPLGGSETKPPCVQVAYALPFNKMYADPECVIEFTVRDLGTIGDYDDSLVTVTLVEDQTGTTKTVTINGVSGVVDVQ
jgi:prepilin-type N-terminal cleavage/methylation domain-containing protein